MSYLKAVLRKDTPTKIKELKKLIILGKKLKKDTRPDIKKLEILEKRKKIISKPKISTTNENPKYLIKSVYTKDNSVIVNFNTRISKDFIKFFELKRGSIFKDVFDIKGNFKDAKPTKLRLSSVNKISIGQFKSNTLRIVLANKSNLKTIYTIKNKQIVISVQSNRKIKAKSKNGYVKVSSLNKFVDLKNNIRIIQAYDNKIVVKFNKNFSKNDLKYSFYKNNNKYENVFDLKGKYAHTKPLKLKIDGITKIIVSTKNEKTVRIRISDKSKLKVFYILNKRELVIKIAGMKTSPATTKQTSTLPYANFKSKVIVIDAGHGAHDPGAVGPNKRYEKVVTLKVAKYLYSILKKRGHKVYLTRSKDTFIKVGKRTDLALRKNADVFISIHANSVPKKSAHKVTGIETYYLSPAKTERAKRVAAKENKTDLRNMSNSSTQSFLASLNSPKLRYSRLLSIDVQREMLGSVRTKYRVKDKGSRPGPFWVLLDAPQASVLVEVGYISNKEEGRRLYTSSYQKLLARGMANGIDAYFEMKARFD
jgi:N-acetylmuramoyl-L-alanine amidase